MNPSIYLCIYSFCAILYFLTFITIVTYKFDDLCTNESFIAFSISNLIVAISSTIIILFVTSLRIILIIIIYEIHFISILTCHVSSVLYISNYTCDNKIMYYTTGIYPLFNVIYILVICLYGTIKITLFNN